MRPFVHSSTIRTILSSVLRITASATPTIFQMPNGCGFKNRIFFITAIGPSRLSNDLAGLDARSSPGLGAPVENRFGLRPAHAPDGSPAPIEPESSRDRLGVLNGVSTFNLHPHLPHFERRGDAAEKLDVLARQAHRFDRRTSVCQRRNSTFWRPCFSRGPASLRALSWSRQCDELWSSTAGGVDSLRRLWRNVLGRPAVSSQKS